MLMHGTNLSKWANLLLDIGKRNALVSFRSTSSLALELVSPSFLKGYDKLLSSSRIEIYDPRLEKDEDFLSYLEEGADKKLGKEEYLIHYGPRAKKSALLFYSPSMRPITNLRNLFRKSLSAIEETGVNILYMAFGLVQYKEAGSEAFLKAPLLLLPVFLENQGANRPYYLGRLEEEPSLNPTLAYKLKEEDGIALPEFDGEKDIEEYLAEVEGLLAPLGFSLLRESYLSIFSFQKMNMYRDLLDNEEKILENPNALALLGEEVPAPAPSQIDEAIHNVVDADSSQIEAILMAKKGLSFVLQGPPGTGKSQTITNIIAESLYEGKRVLFVSEKLAALNVVYDKLKKASLEEFTLELHSHKASKKQVIDELNRTLFLPHSVVTPIVEEEIKAKEESEKTLDAYEKELHAHREEIGMSLYEALEEASSYRKYPDSDYVIPDIANKGKDHVKKADSLLAHYGEYASRLGEDYRLSPYYGLTWRDESHEGKKKLEILFKEGKNFFISLSDRNKKMKSSCGLKADNLKDFSSLIPLLSFLSSSLYISPIIFNEKDYSSFKGKWNSLSALRGKIHKLDKEILSSYEKGIYDLLDEVKEAKKDYPSFLKRLFSKDYRRKRKEISSWHKAHKKLSYKEIVQLSSLLASRDELYQDFLAKEEFAKEALSSSYIGLESDFPAIESELKDLEGYLKNPGIKLLSIMDKGAFAENKENFAKFAKQNESFLKKNEGLLGNLKALFLKKSLDVEKAGFLLVALRLETCLASFGEVESHLAFLALLDEIKGAGLLPYVDHSLDNGVAVNDFAPIYHKAFYYQYADMAILSSPSLSSLSRFNHDEVVKRFKSKDKTSFSANKGLIKEKLSSLRPDTSLVAGGSAVSRLILEGQKKRRQMSIRSLLSSMEELIFLLKPCILMSPLSVATYLSPDCRFDLVIFDEASQIFPQDALGAIYRSKQVIIVGDSQQMPPSNFFMTSIEEEEDEEMSVKDFDSILDIANAVFPQKRLAWHYRSRYEELIAFSNKNFYSSSLLTFPSSSFADGKEKGVSYHFVDGIYDRASRTNMKEAEKVISLIYEHIAHSPEKSLGIVAFSLAQQSLIEALLNRKRRIEDHEEFFSMDKAEPFFIKNLETVQGDERDVIIFSTCYGKDQNGKLLLNFGPLNKEGGERRLNVAITRAKNNVKLVTSLHYDDIDLERTNSRGSSLLRDYLEYAEKGADSYFMSAQSLSPFEQEIGEFLASQGYKFDYSVGTSASPIDIAVRKDDSSYLLAVESDGPIYHSFKSARDRDRLREEKLESMGWHHHRIWSTDWHRNQSLEKKELLKAINDAMEEKGEIRKEKEKEEEPDFVVEETRKESSSFPYYEMVDPHSLTMASGNIILEIIRKEGPINEKWLLSRIVYLYGKTKVTKAIEAKFYLSLMPQLQQRGVIRKDGYLSMSEEIPMLRLNKEGAPKREIFNIHPQELAKGMRQIIEENVFISKDGLYRSITKLLSFERMGNLITSALDRAFEELEDEIEEEDGMIHLRK